MTLSFQEVRCAQLAAVNGWAQACVPSSNNRSEAILMSAYVIFIRQRTIDPAELDLYRSKAPAARQGHDLTPIVYYGDFEVLEGTPIEGAVILRFPTMAAARAWYRSPAYQEALAHRLKGSDYQVMLVNGVEPAAASQP
jgi:uncharacterized protein (DUF1330 family)